MLRATPAQAEAIQSIEQTVRSAKAVLRLEAQSALSSSATLQHSMTTINPEQFIELVTTIDTYTSSNIFNAIQGQVGPSLESNEVRTYRLFIPIAYSRFGDLSQYMIRELNDEDASTCWFVALSRAYIRLITENPEAMPKAFREKWAAFNAYSLLALTKHLVKLQEVYIPEQFQPLLDDLSQLFQHPEFQNLLRLNTPEVNQLLRALHEEQSPVENWIVDPKTMQGYLTAYAEVEPAIETEKTTIFQGTPIQLRDAKRERIRQVLRQLWVESTSLLDIIPTSGPVSSKEASSDDGFKPRMFALPIVGDSLKTLFGEKQQQRSLLKLLLSVFIILVLSPYALVAAAYIGFSNRFLNKQIENNATDISLRAVPGKQFESDGPQTPSNNNTQVSQVVTHGDSQVRPKP